MLHKEIVPDTTAELVRAELVSRDYLVAFGDELGVTTKSAELSSSAGTDRAVLVWSFSTDKPGIPSLARKFLSDEVTLTWDQSWSGIDDAGGAAGELLVTLDGKPGARSTGTASITGAGSGVALVTDTSTRTTLPRLVAAGIEMTIDKELVGWIIAVQARVLRRRLEV